jgi:hypothetical protein
MLSSQALQLLQQYLVRFAAKDDFEDTIESIYGNKLGGIGIRTQWLNGDFSLIPEIEVLSGGELGEANGAYAASLDKIFVSADFLSAYQDDVTTIARVLLEEVGHKLDRLFNGTVDTIGDEGAIFSALVSEQTLSSEQLQQLQIEDDRSTIILNDRIVQIERAQPVSRSGGAGGITLPYQLDPLPQGQKEKNVTFNYSYEHFSIPDQFEIRYGATTIFSTGGLVSNGKSGSKSFKQVLGDDRLTIKVTAPQAGTAWQFSVSTDPAEINVAGL